MKTSSLKITDTTVTGTKQEIDDLVDEIVAQVNMALEKKSQETKKNHVKVSLLEGWK